MPESSGKCFSNSVNASNPPADAPTPTIEKVEVGTARGGRAERERGKGADDFDALRSTPRLAARRRLFDFAAKFVKRFNFPVLSRVREP
jgi:hypothetical protein